MTSAYGISGIGNPLGMMGLGFDSSYSSFDNYMPSMMGMNSSGYGSSVFGGGMMSGMGGMGMYNPLYYSQLQNQMEINGVKHAGDMHSAVLNNEVKAYYESDDALVKKILKNADIRQCISNLYDKVKEGDQDGICHEYSKLKNAMFYSYKNEIEARGDKTNPAVGVRDIIDEVYGNYVTSVANDGKTHHLKDDIDEYGHGALFTGFMNGFRTDSSKKYIDQTKREIYGLDIDQEGAKEKRKKYAKLVGQGASFLEKGVYGAGTGIATYGAYSMVTKFLQSTLGKVPINAYGKNLNVFYQLGKTAFNGKAAGIIAGLCCVGGMLLDGYWQLSKD